VSEIGWADKILLGDLLLTDVPVMQANSSGMALHASSNTEYVATLGLAALKRLDIVLDGRQGAIWLRPKKTPPTAYRHNRLGAAFAPKDLHGGEMIAHVANGSPAFEAGIRNGDVLWRAGKHDATHWWNSNTKADGNDTFKDLPPGTKIDFTLKRNGKLFKTTATLRNTLPPDAGANST
jgi:predicted metalloprotease with PDZ domain